MYLSSLNYGNTVLNDYIKPMDESSKTAIIVLINVLLFGSVIIFVGIFLYNFIRAYQGKDPIEFNFGKKENGQSNNSMKSRYVEKKSSIRNNFKPKSNICNVCGEANETDAKFCKNCGTRL